MGIVGFDLDVRAESSAKYNFFTCDPLFVEVRCLILSEVRFQHTVKMLMTRLWSIVIFGSCAWARKSRDIQLATFRRHILATSPTQISNLICVFSMELGNHIDETTSGKSPSGSRVGVVYKGGGRSCRCATLRGQFHEGAGQESDCTISSKSRAENSRRRDPKRWQHLFAYRFRSHAHDVCSSLAEVSPCGNPPFPCVSKCGCSW